MKNLEKNLKKCTSEFLSIGRALDNRAKQLIKRINLKNSGGINCFLVTHNKSEKESTSTGKMKSKSQNRRAIKH
jgi:hypothetical protein